MTLPTIGTLWIGGELGLLEKLCLTSFVQNGHEVVLFAYDRLDGVPEGVRVESAADIMPTDRIIRHAKTGSPAYHADQFRLHMLRQADLIWADTDAYCCRPWDLPAGGHLHGWLSDDAPLVNNGVLGLPRGSATLAEMLAFTSDEYPVPPWFAEERRADLTSRKERGAGVHVSLLPWGVWGPNALTWFLRQTGEIEHSLPGHVLYPLKFKHARFPFVESRRAQVERMVRPDTLSIHFWGRRFRTILGKFGGVPDKGTFVDALMEKHGIAIADRRPRAPATGTPKVPEDALDISMFSTGDVANMILQRSEVVRARDVINQWTAGNEAPLLELAGRDPEGIIRSTLDVVWKECGVFLGAIDRLGPGRIADIGCGYAFADLLLYRRYGCDIVLIDIEESAGRHFGFAETGAGYADLRKARDFLERNGVPAEKILTINPRHQDLSEAGVVDVALSQVSCGFHYPIETYEAFFERSVRPEGAIMLDVRKGSGGIRAAKRFGTVEVLARQPKHSSIVIHRAHATV